MKTDKVTWRGPDGKRRQISKAKLSWHWGGTSGSGGYGLPCGPSEVKETPKKRKK